MTEYQTMQSSTSAKHHHAHTAERALGILRTTFGYPAFRGSQQEIVTHVADGGDALVLMPTGGGKSLCYQIPALLRSGVGIVVSPLIALMQDQVDALLQAGVRAAFLNSTLDWFEVQEIERKLFGNQLDLLYIAPERLAGERSADLINRLHTQNRIALFAIDEAHCVSQWGHDFRPEYLQLSALHERYPDIPRIALTATADEATRNEIVQRLGLDEAQIFISSFDRPNIRYTVVEKDNPRKQLLAFLSDHKDEAGVIYCMSRKKVEEIAEWLNQQGYAALPYHAGLSNEIRAKNQRRFLREDGLVICATIAFGMGIDKPDVRFVAHLDLPKSLEAYYQETGRAGRDGEPSEAWMTYGLQDVVLQRSRIDESNAPPEQKRIEAQKLNALLGYCEAPYCRRVVLLNYFGEEFLNVSTDENNVTNGNHAHCGNCDVCLNPPHLYDGSIVAQKALSAVYRTGQRFGAVHIIDVLRGKQNDKAHQWGHDKFAVFGVGAELDDTAWRAVLRQLVAAGILYADLTEHGALKLTEDARPLLKGEHKFQLRQQVVKKSSGKPKSTIRKATVITDLSPEDVALFERLRQWRTETAREQGVPAYVILVDHTLKELAEMRPTTRGHLSMITGIGSTKIDRYGEELLAMIQAN